MERLVENSETEGLLTASVRRVRDFFTSPLPTVPMSESETSPRSKGADAVGYSTLSWGDLDRDLARFRRSFRFWLLLLGELEDSESLGL